MTLITRQGKGSKLTIQEMDGNLTYLEQLAQQGGGLEGTQYLFVAANGTDIENAAELQAAYDLAKTMSPSATNRITVIAAPGNYNFGSAFVMDTQYIDLVSLDGNRSIVFNGTGTISITANDVFVKGVNVLTKNFTIENNLNLLKVENCQGGDNSFGGQGIASGTFINCIGGGESFGGQGIASGTFINCQGGSGSFGGTASGTFINCQGGDISFGGVGTASGTFTNCQGGDLSFGGTASGTFTNCVGGDVSFGGGGDASGTFTNCQGGNESFGGVGTASGTFTDCIGDILSFGGEGQASGTFTNCQGGELSFGYFGTASGTFTNCVGGDGSFGSNGNASGTFTNCVGGVDSFGGNSGTLSGKLFYCRLTSGTFPTVSGSGVTVLCIDGNNAINTQN
jgi:hypothetical protein